MKDPVSEIKKKLDAALSRNNRGRVIFHRCERDGCCVLLDERFSSHRALIDMDHRSLGLTNKARCDYLLIAGSRSNCWVVPIELTSGNKKSSVVKKQLDAGSEFANRNLHPSAKVKFLPVFANNGIRKKADRDRMKNLRIKFRGRTEVLRLLRCGEPLSNALKQRGNS